MPIKVTCSCGKTLTAPDAAAGKRAKCPGCGQVITVPAPVQDAELVGAAAASDPYGIAEPVPAAASPGGGEQRQPCPECGEMIIVGAAKCRFCNAIFDPKLKQMVGGKDLTLKPIAQFQKAMMICLLVQILSILVVTVFVASTGPRRGMPPLAMIASLVFWIGHIAGAVLAIILASRLYSVLATVFLGILAIIPCIGLIGLLIINSAATSKLQLNGIKVGFLGANLSKL